MTTVPPIVFVHIGDALPGHLAVAAAQARRFDVGDIWLVAPERALAAASPGLTRMVRAVPCERLGRSPTHRRYERLAPAGDRFRGGFWRYTTERFFFLETLMAEAGLERVIHLENDVMLYADLTGLMPVFEGCYPALAATFDAPGRCVPGFVYARDAGAVGALTRFVVEVLGRGGRWRNDMALLAGFRVSCGRNALDTLPIVPSGCPHLFAARLGPDPRRAAAAFWNRFASFEAVFDAAAVGQYLGGIDPRNSAGAETAGFINETCVFDPSRYRYRWRSDERGRRVPTMADAGGEYRLVNLHVHSKALERFAS